MFSAIGWIWVQEADYPDEVGYPASYPRPPVLAAIGQVLERLRPDAQAALLREYNGACTLLIDRHHNHRVPWPTDLFREVARLAPGSFGYLHVYDDEHSQERYRFMKWSMLQGRITVEEDPTLVPVVVGWYDGRHPDTIS